jgi:hypothetical protein
MCRSYWREDEARIREFNEETENTHLNCLPDTLRGKVLNQPLRSGLRVGVLLKLRLFRVCNVARERTRGELREEEREERRTATQRKHPQGSA